MDLGTFINFLFGWISLGIIAFLVVKALSKPSTPRVSLQKTGDQPMKKPEELPSEEEDPKGWYSIIEDAGYAQEISYEEYLKIKNVDEVLFNYKKTIAIDSKDDAVEEILSDVSERIPEFTYTFEKEMKSGYLPGYRRGVDWVYIYKGEICGEPIQTETIFPHFVPDILNPILSKKFGKQLLFIFPGSDSYEFILVGDEHGEKLKNNKFLGDYKLVEKFYGYTQKS